MDDEYDILDSLKIEFWRSFRMFTTENSLQAMEVAAKNEIDSVLSSVRMPNENGPDLLARTKEE